MHWTRTLLELRKRSEEREILWKLCPVCDEHKDEAGFRECELCGDVELPKLPICGDCADYHFDHGDEYHEELKQEAGAR